MHPNSNHGTGALKVYVSKSDGLHTHSGTQPRLWNRFGIADTKPDSVKELIYEATAYAMWKGRLIESVRHQVLLLNRAQDRR